MYLSSISGKYVTFADHFNMCDGSFSEEYPEYDSDFSIKESKSNFSIKESKSKVIA